MQTKKQSMHYAWLILIACCMMQGAGLGLISNCAGVFFSPVCNDLGFEMGKFTLFRTLFTMAQALTLPYVAKLFRKYDVRVIISAATVIMGGISILQGTFTSLWQFYVFGIIQGCAAAFIGVIPAPILLGNWFYKNTGTAVGISAAFSGLVGMIGSSALGVLIPAYGWRTSYMIIGVAAMVLILPFSLFILRYKPEDKGMLPYGADENYVSKTDAKAAAKKEKFSDFAKQPIFYISLTAYACSIISSYLNSFLPSCGLEAGLPMAAAALLTSLALCGNMTTKLFLGKLCDSYGVIKIFVLSIVVAIVGHGLIFIGSTAPMMAGALLYGITMPLSTVLMPLFCRLFWKGDTYASAYSYVSMFGMLISAPFNTLFGTMYDMTGNYDLTIISSTAFVVVVLVMVILPKFVVKREA
ncbi:MAG: MFS transporter [Lachnospiraceae bacterium]|nr:MFS transporter [Lachnospiraceae bacterium]MBQ2401802.1 MFS transporter [Lachnospiraceae bacterium]MBQ5599937.1 MFS transporter [Lachnospiraceae bacterium]MBQ5868970.1 MFS transporter [Lachnospiraceae bacterium]MBQ5915404.1 MFS transporter [Lachnospiraceae bacterium]